MNFTNDNNSNNNSDNDDNSNIEKFDDNNSDNSEKNSEEYISIEELMTSKDFYQIQLNNDKLIIKCIGKTINKNDTNNYFKCYEKNNLTFYNKLYYNEDFDINNITKLFCVIKMSIVNGTTTNSYNISVKFNTIEFNKELDDFELYYTELVDGNFSKKLINNDINKDNIINKLVDLSIEN